MFHRMQRVKSYLVFGCFNVRVSAINKWKDGEGFTFKNPSFKFIV
jgi:hypothetical protein